MILHLVRTPVPDSHDGDPKDHSRPGQVAAACVPQQAEGVLAGSVTLAGDVVALRIHGGEAARGGRPVFVQQGAVTSDLSESWKPTFTEQQ